MKKLFYGLVLIGIILSTRLQAQNYWLEFKVNDTTKYYPIAQIQKVDFSDVANVNSQLFLHFVDSTNKAFPIKSIKEIQFTEDTVKKEYNIIISMNDNTKPTFKFDQVYQLEITTPTSIGEEISFVSISENYPNPFQNNTTIEFSLLVDCNLDVSIYDLFGNRKTNIDNSIYTKGKHIITWDGTATDGSDAAPGIYYCTLRSDKGAIINKMLKVR